MAFSSAVKLGDLNDFIAPSQACVVSLQQQQPKQQPANQPPVKQSEGVQLNARPVRAGSKQQDGGAGGGGFKQTVLEGDAVKVSLADCLACSGCVTSAETVLLEAQSLKEFAARCADPDAVVVVSVSPQSRASLAALHGMRADEVQGVLAHFLKHRLSVALVLDIGLGHALALTEAAAEFVGRKAAAAATAAAAAGGSGANGTSTSTTTSGSSAVDAGPLPLLASACPGWVCYAEKTHGAPLLPHLAAARSPQAVMGALVKRVLAPRRGWRPRDVYHVTVMPCYDKKLEATREDFALDEGLGSGLGSEVDASLTTGELQQLLQQYCGAAPLRDLPRGRGDCLLQLLTQAAAPGTPAANGAAAAPPPPLPRRLPEPTLHASPGGSGGYAAHVFAAAALLLYGVDLRPLLAAAAPPRGGRWPPFRALRNADMQELLLLGPSDGGGGSNGTSSSQEEARPLLRVALAYGFRNITSLARQAKQRRCAYDYVEVMACPSGCLNGGGQLKPAAGESAAQLLERLELLHFAAEHGVAAAAAVAAEEEGAEGGKQQDAAAAATAAEVPPAVAAAAAACGVSVAPGVVRLLRPPPPPPPLQQLVPPLRGREALAALAPAFIDVDALAAAYAHVLGAAGPGDPAAAALLRTGYHARERSLLSTVSDW